MNIRHIHAVPFNWFMRAFYKSSKSVSTHLCSVFLRCTTSMHTNTSHSIERIFLTSIFSYKKLEYIRRVCMACYYTKIHIPCCSVCFVGVWGCVTAHTSLSLSLSLSEGLELLIEQRGGGGDSYQLTGVPFVTPYKQKHDKTEFCHTVQSKTW